MSRRPLSRPDPSASSGTSSGLRPPASPFSETVRIINRKAKPREPKRNRIILNLKVIDKVTKPPIGRPKIPSRNRVIGKSKKYSESMLRNQIRHLKYGSFSLYSKPALRGPDEEKADNKSTHQGLEDESSTTSGCPSPAPSDDRPPKLLPETLSPAVPDWRESEALDLSIPPESSASKRGQVEPEESDPEEEAGDWRPDMSPCSNVVVTDVTSNLLTVTIKEFCNAQDFEKVAAVGK